MGTCVNIMLMGETGVGKSTLINSFANYSAYGSFEEACKSPETICLIPIKFNITDENFKDIRIREGKDDPNELLEEGESATMACKSYVFKLSDGNKIRFIDSSGFAATQGDKQSKASVNDIVRVIEYYKNIHAVAFVLNGSNPEISIDTMIRFSQILSCLIDNAMKNILFLCTHCQNPGNYQLELQSKFKKINVKIDEKTIFCFENKPFRLLMTIKNKLKIDDRETRDAEKMWRKATGEFQRLLKCAAQLDPKNVKVDDNVKYLQHIRAIIKDILANITANKKLLKQCNDEINTKSGQELISCMSIRNMTIEKSDIARTVCISRECRKNNAQGTDFDVGTNACCDGCKEDIKTLRSCKTFNIIEVCKICKCHVKNHTLIFYKVTHPIVQMEEAKNIKNIEPCQQLHKARSIIQTKLQKLEHEEKTIEEAKSIMKDYYKSKKNILNFRFKSFFGQSKPIKVTLDQMFTIRSKIESLETYGPKIDSIMKMEEDNCQIMATKLDINVSITNKTFKLN